MGRRARLITYGSAAGLVLLGAGCAILIGGVAGQAVGVGLIGVGLVGAISLAFLEVGLSEDRQRSADQARARETRPEQQRPPDAAGGARLPRRLPRRRR